jgi:hypothetical protein
VESPENGTAALTAVRGEIEAGLIEATPVQEAYLCGAIAGLTVSANLAESSQT